MVSFTHPLKRHSFTKVHILYENKCDFITCQLLGYDNCVVKVTSCALYTHTKESSV